MPQIIHRDMIEINCTFFFINTLLLNRGQTSLTLFVLWKCMFFKVFNIESCVLIRNFRFFVQLISEHYGLWEVYYLYLNW